MGSKEDGVGIRNKNKGAGVGQSWGATTSSKAANKTSRNLLEEVAGIGRKHSTGEFF
jgi:hypothetical protein